MGIWAHGHFSVKGVTAVQQYIARSCLRQGIGKADLIQFRANDRDLKAIL